MGQQQLLLLVLGVVLVGLAIVAGLSAYASAQQAALEDIRRNKMVDYATQAQAWKRLHPMRGGQPDAWRSDPDSFEGFEVAKIGLTPVRVSGTVEHVETAVGCFRLDHGASGIDIHALEPGCDDATESLHLRVRGVEAGDLSWP